MTVIINGTNGITSVNGTAAAPSVTGTDTDTGIVYGTNTLSLATGGTTAVTVNSSQRVGINNATPQGALDVGGLNDGSSAGDLLVTTASTAAVVTVGRISGTSSDNTNFRVRNRVDQQAFFVNSGNRTAQVGLTFGVGNATPATTGSGITFPASQDPSSDANTLDDYEEGTFTPNFAPQTGSWTTTSAKGFYTKIGNTVALRMYLTITTVGTGTGSISVTNLPFTSFNPSVGAGNRAAIGVVREDASVGFMAQIFIDGNNTTGGLQGSAGGAIGQASGYIYDITVTYCTST